MTKKAHTAEQQALRDAAIAESLTRAGLGQVFQKKGRSLKELGKPGEAITRIMDEAGFRANVLAGRGFNLQCRSHKSFDAAYLLTRALCLTKLRVRVVGLIDLARYLDDPEKDWTRTRFEDFDALQALVIPRFYEPKYMPLPPLKVQAMEWWLAQRMDDGLSVSVQYQGDLTKQDIWQPYLVGKLEERNEKVELA